jgi:hypothetical protein
MSDETTMGPSFLIPFPMVVSNVPHRPYIAFLLIINDEVCLHYTIATFFKSPSTLISFGKFH